MQTATKAFEEVREHAESIKNDEAHAIPSMDVGDMWAQGDVGFLRLAKLPAGVTKIAKPSAQLAPGTTQGSRHCLTTLDGVTLYRLANPTPLDGPVIDAPNGCEVDHPEHGNVTLPPGVYGVTFQRAYAAELRRVQD